MKKKTLSLIVLLFCVATAYSQYVTIPDSAFRSQLKIKYPGCFNGADQMDTTCPGILNEKGLYFYNFGVPGCINTDHVQNITGFKYFKNLDSFIMISGGVDSILDWPRKLKYINLNDLGLQQLPAYFPDSMATFLCLPNAGSAYPYVDKPLPAFPPTLVKFAVGLFNLTQLPAFPASLKHFELSSNQLSSLPPLPAGLEYLQISGKLVSLPPLPNSLKHLDCKYNLLNSIPPLPNTLEILFCQFNGSLTSLPPLPSTLKELDVSGTNITCLPVLPNNLQKIYFSRNITKCLPNINNNIVNQYSGNIPPLCNVTNNINSCTAFPVITGSAFYDANSNGVKEANEFYKPNNKIELSNGNITFTDNNGNYDIGTTALGTITLTPSNTFFNVAPSSKNFIFTTYDTTVFQNIAYQPAAVVDSMQVNMTPIFSWTVTLGRRYGYWIDARNVGSGNFGAITITINYDNTKLIFDSSSNPSIINSGNTLTLNLTSFPIGARVSFQAYFTVRNNLVLGDTAKAIVTLSNGTHAVSDSTLGVVVNSFDPNDKSATPKLSPAQVAGGKYIDYVIRYQNTGNGVAYNVVVTDTLSPHLLPNTLEMISASHNTKTTITGNAVSFEMRNIMLPASSASEPKSHGFIRFRIKPKSTLVLGDTIKNKAAIYFDYNSPVITNTALTLIKNESTLPLRLISFKGSRNSDGNIHLLWTTANEVDTKTFVVEQSSNGREFFKNGEVSTVGFGNNAYSYDVQEPAGSNVYFRLKMVDRDGRFSYTQIVFIKSKNNTGFLLSDNPVKNEIILTSITPSLFHTEGVLLNNTGSVVKRFTIHSSSQTIEVNNLSSGVYFLKTMQGNEKVIIGR